MEKSIGKKIFTAFVFVAVMGITFFAVFKNQDMSEIFDMLSEFPGHIVAITIFLAFVYVALDGVMIYGMLGNDKKKVNIFRCFGYAFICFFYSGVTPSASGGQPMQLVYMGRDGLSVARSCAALTAVEAMKKSILAVSGLVILVFFGGVFTNEFVDYAGWFYLGWGIVFVWSVFLWVLMFAPSKLEKLAIGVVNLLAKIKIFSKLKDRDGSIVSFFDGYRDVDRMLIEKKRRFVFLFGECLVQRLAIVFITILILDGYGTPAYRLPLIFVLQLAILVAVDMLPLPGGQGITEILYQSVFATLISVNLITPSMMIQRFVAFYVILIFGATVSLVMHVKKTKSEKRRAV